MIDIITGKIKVNGEEEQILRYAVWFSTPFGLFEFADDAIQRVALADLDPHLNVRPVSVAVGLHTYEVCGT